MSNSFRVTYIVAVVLLTHSALGGQFAAADSAAADSSRPRNPSYTFDEILVTASRLPQAAGLSSSPVTILTGSDIERTNATSLAHLLAPVAGMFVKDYGGASGLKTLAQRGLGPEHTLVLVNGMRVGNPQNNLVDLGLFSSDEIDRIEVVHGGSSSSFGADAVAGVLNIVTQPVHSDMLRASAGFGSFGYRTLEVSGGVAAGNLGVRGTYREERGDDDFPFVFRNGPVAFAMARQNADFHSRTGLLHSSLNLSTKSQIALFARSFDSERGVGGLVTGPASAAAARQSDKSNLVQLKSNSQLSRQVELRFGTQMHHVYQRYYDRGFLIGTSALDNYYKILEWRLEPGVEYRIGDRSRIALGGELARTSAEGNSLALHLRRYAYGVYTALEQRLLDSSEVLSALTFYPSLRLDAIETAGVTVSSWSPQAGLAAAFAPVAGVRPTVRFSIGRSFRAPTLNELYYAGGGGIGNPNLLPERSTNLDAGISIEFLAAGKHQLSASYFIIDMADRIVWVAASGNVVTPRNIRRVRSSGIEALYRWTAFAGRLGVVCSYTLSSTTKTSEDFPGDPNVGNQLVYVPQESAHISVGPSIPLEGWLREIGGSVAVRHVSFRFTNEDNTNFLPSYVLADVNLRARFALAPLNLLARFEVNNLFDTEYQTIIAYPMPGRSFKVALGVEY